MKASMVLPQMVVNWPRSVVCAGPAKLISLDYHKQKFIVDETLDIANMCYFIKNSKYRCKKYNVHDV